MPVHLFGRPAPLAELASLGLPLIEDAAQAFGAAGVASTGVCSTFSFFPTKNLFALGDGGLVACRDDEVAERVRMLRFHGSRDKQTFELVGTNSRLDAIHAAALRVFLPRLAGWNEGRRLGAARYAELGLGDVVEIPVDEPGHVYHMYVRPHAGSRPDLGRTEGGGHCVGVVLRDAVAPAARDALPGLRAGLAARDGARRRREPRAAPVGLHRRRRAGAGRRDRARVGRGRGRMRSRA